MSQIDEAFIQAYATPQQPAAAPGVGEVPVVPPQPPLAGLHHGPRMQSQQVPVQPITSPSSATPPASSSLPTTESEVSASVAWKPEPVPSPHFRAAPAATPAATPSIETATPVAPPTAAPIALPAERRPLSTFSAPEQPATTEFNPVFEVDAFRWPKITDELLSAHSKLLIPVAEQLLDVSEQGRSLVGIAGTRPNVGCSTLLLCLARLVGTTGKSVALVDANFAKASLGSDLGLQFDTGWENVLTGELPLAECVVKSLDDRMTLLPIAKQHTHAHELLASIHTSVTAGVLRYHYDLVLFNLGVAAQPPQDMAAHSIMQHCRLDAGIIIADTERTGIDPMDTLLSVFGSNCLGVIGNSAV